MLGTLRARQLRLQARVPGQRRSQCPSALLAGPHEISRERFERDERATLQAGRYTSLVLPPHRLTRSESAAGSARTRHPAVEVEQRPLAAYTRLTGAEADG